MLEATVEEKVVVEVAEVPRAEVAVVRIREALALKLIEEELLEVKPLLKRRVHQLQEEQLSRELIKEV